MKKRMDKLVSCKFKKSAQGKERNYKQSQAQMIKTERIFAIHVTDKGLFSKYMNSFTN